MIKIENMDYPIEELIPIVAEISSKYSGYEHSSITYEKAQMLMESVLYCINECKENNNNALLVNHIPAKEAYKYGQDIVINKTKKLHSLYNELIIDFQDYGSECLKNTITKEIPMFLSRYDFKYAPQETLLTLDYPVLKNLGAMSGVNLVLEYMECIYLEQQFLKIIDVGYVLEILRAYHSDYEVLIENICEIVLQNIVGHIMLDKPLDSKGFDKEELKNLESILLKKSTEEIYDRVTKILKLLTTNYYDGDTALLGYLTCGISNLVTRIQCNLKNHCLNNIFLI